MPSMLHEIVADAVAGQADMVIVGSFDGKDALLPALAGSAIDVVVIGVQRADDLSMARQILGPSRLARVLLVAVNGRSAAMYELRPHKVSLGEVSTQGLVNAIRGQRTPSTDGAAAAGRRARSDKD
jgi:hypothetical protein